MADFRATRGPQRPQPRPAQAPYAQSPAAQERQKMITAVMAQQGIDADAAAERVDQIMALAQLAEAGPAARDGKTTVTGPLDGNGHSAEQTLVARPAAATSGTVIIVPPPPDPVSAHTMLAFPDAAVAKGNGKALAFPDADELAVAGAPPPATLAIEAVVPYTHSMDLRWRLVHESPQKLNPRPQGPPEELGPGTALTHALLLTGTSVLNARLNGLAILAVAAQVGLALSPDVQDAVTRLAAGRTSILDLYLLQAALTRLCAICDTGCRSDGPGIVTVPDMVAVVTLFRQQGAFGNHKVLIQMATHNDRTTGDPVHQWTCTVDGVHANGWPNDGDNRRSYIGDPPGYTKRSSPRWQGSVRFKKTEIVGRMRAWTSKPGAFQRSFALLTDGVAEASLIISTVRTALRGSTPTPMP